MFPNPLPRLTENLAERIALTILDISLQMHGQLPCGVRIVGPSIVLIGVSDIDIDISRLSSHEAVKVRLSYQ